MSISQLIDAYGYLAVFLLVGAESLGVPVPGETALIAAGTYAGHTHRLSPWGIVAMAILGAIIGDSIGFWVGYRGGYRLVWRFGRRLRLDERKLKVGRYIFDAHGPKVVFFGRFVSILRTYAAFLAGMNRMRWRRFLAANIAGAIVWAGIFTVASYFAGNALSHLSGMLSVVIGAAALLSLAACGLVVRRQANAIARQAEAAFAGPMEYAMGHTRGDVLWPRPCPGQENHGTGF